MAYDIGPKIGIEGEKEFRNSINDINTSMRTLKSEAKLLASEYDKNNDSQESLIERSKNLNKQMELQQDKISKLKKGLDESAKMYGENDTKTKKWQQSVNEAATELNKMEKELKDNESAISNFGNEIDDVEKKTSKFKSGISNLAEGLKNVGSKIGTAAVTSIKAVGTAAVAAGAGIFGLAKNAGESADELITLANKTGLSVERLQELQYASNFVDVDLETMTGSMAKLTKTMDSARGGTGAAADAFKALGISVKDDVTGELRNNKDVWAETLDALNGVANETERDALAMQLFGKSAQELNPLIVAGADELGRLSEEAHNVGAVLSDEAIEAGGKFDDELQKLTASAKGAALQLGTAFLPVVSNVVSNLTTLIPAMVEAFQTGDFTQIGDQLLTALQGMLNQVVEILPGLTDVAVQILTGIITALVTVIPDVLPLLVTAAVELINALATLLIEQGPTLIETAITSIMSFIEGLSDSLPLIVEAAITILMSLVDTIINNLPKLIPVAINMIVTLVKGIINALPKIIEAMPQLVTAVVNGIVENLPMLIDAAVDLIVALVSALVENVPLLAGAALEIIVALAGGLLAAVPQLLLAIPELFTEMYNAFLEVDWESIGKACIDGIADGIKNAATNVVDSVKKTAKKAFDGVKDFFGIKSPSRLFRDEIGTNIGLGWAEGIKGTEKDVEQAINEVNRTITDDIDYGPSGPFGRPRGGGSGGSIINVEVPLSLDGRKITKATSTIQYGKNKNNSRSLGVIPV